MEIRSKDLLERVGIVYKTLDGEDIDLVKEENKWLRIELETLKEAHQHCMSMCRALSDFRYALENSKACFFCKENLSKKIEELG